MPNYPSAKIKMTFVVPTTTVRYCSNVITIPSSIRRMMIPYYEFYSRWIGSQRSIRSLIIGSSTSLLRQHQQQQPTQRTHYDTQEERFPNHQQNHLRYAGRSIRRRSTDCSSILYSTSRFLVLLFLAIEFLLVLTQALDHSTTFRRSIPQNENYLTITTILLHRFVLVASAFTIFQQASSPSIIINPHRIIRSDPKPSSSPFLPRLQQQQRQLNMRHSHHDNHRPLFMFKKPNENENTKSNNKKKEKQIIQIQIDPKQKKTQDRNPKANKSDENDDENILWNGLNLLRWNKDDSNSTDGGSKKNEKEDKNEEGSKRKAIQSIFENTFFSKNDNSTTEVTKTTTKNESGFKKLFPFFDSSDTDTNEKSSKLKRQKSDKKKPSKTKGLNIDEESKEPYNPLSSIQKYTVSLLESIPKVSFSMPNITMPTINVSLPQISFPFGSNITKKMQRLRQKEEEWVEVMPKTRISPGEMVPVTAGGIDLLVIASTDGRRLYCIANSCPHLGTPFETGQLTRLPKEEKSISTTGSSATTTSDSNDNKSNNIDEMVATGRRTTTIPPFTETSLSDLLQQDGCEDCIVCPLHRTAFALESGEVRGEWCPYPPVLGKVVGAVKPPTPAAVFDIRTRGKNIEVRINTPLV